eukprot:gnl/Spiro4/18449_TR9874_c0_g1_i1.p1 gnl/Spiro4/18449_TR9874_c0_g1~~gnl/Spiro4/18449_TR9874_c0_g1_i1.p1  ORF type:complete len:157 (-),score=25.24 gnl/Spiro4/18449_TR9874_c0_g1_i1:81-551(-)
MLLGAPKVITLDEQLSIDLAVRSIVKAGGVVPYVPTPALRMQPGDRDVVIVEADRLIREWNVEHPNWHSMAVLGVASTEASCQQWWLCKQTWSGYPPWVLLPIVDSCDFKHHDELWSVYAVNMRHIQQGWPIQEDPISLADSSALPDSFSDLPDAR